MPEDRRPLLAVVFNPQVLVLQLVEAAAGAWRFAWLIDRTSADVDASLRLLRRFGAVVDISGLDARQAAEQLATHEPSGIIAFAEVELMRAASIGECLGLPVQSAETVARLTNKLAQRRALQAAGLPTPAFRAIPSGADAALRLEVSRAIRYPAIVKPQAGLGSRDTYRVHDEQELSRVVELSRGHDLIVEELLRDSWPRAERPHADFVSVESILARGRLSHLTITGRATLAEPFRETGNFIPSNLPADVGAQIMDVAGRAVEAMGTDTGVFHTEVKVTPDGPRVIEVNGRVGGAIPELFSLATEGKFSLLETACRVALGEPLHFAEPVPCSRVGYSILMQPPFGATRLAGLDNVDKVRQIPGVHLLQVNRQPGDPVDWHDGYTGNVITVYGVADDHDAMWDARRRAYETVAMEFA